jgi:hypothetical protein
MFQLDPAQIAFLLCAMAIAAYYARAAFDTPLIELGDGPTLPRYMTQPRQYRLGVIAYIVICLAFYDLGTYFFRDLLPLANFVAPAWLQKVIESAAANGMLSFPLTVVLAAVIFFILLKTETDWNPLLLLRRLVWGWVSIPQLANAIMLKARDALVVPIELRAEVASHSDAPHVDVGDFEKDRNSLDRNWAELCYIRLSLAQNRAEGSHYTFFNEPSFAWENLDADYASARRDIALAKQPLDRGQVPDLKDVATKVKALRSQYCRLAACFLVFKNETKHKVIDEAITFGVPMDNSATRSNPMRYIFIFLAAIIISIYVGVSISAMIWDLIHGDYSNAINQDLDLVTRWIGYSMANYGMPIMVTLLMGYLGWTVNHNQSASYPITYAMIFVVALCVSTLSLTSAVKFVSVSSHATKPFVDLLLLEFKWSLSPALVTLYIAYHVDRQIDPLLPDIASWGSGQLRQRIIMCVVFALIVTWLSLQPALSLTPSSPTTWPVEKLRAVVIGTTFTIGLVMALVSEFCLIKPRQAAKAGASRPSSGGGLDTQFPRSPDALPSH